MIHSMVEGVKLTGAINNSASRIGTIASAKGNI